MKKIYTLVLFVFLAAGSYAQDFAWAHQAGLWAYDYGMGIGTDAQGNVYVAGKYEQNNAVFGSTTVQCAGNHDAFLAKYSSNGTFQWVRTGGGADGDYARCIAVDAAGNSYIAGEIEGTAMFGTTQVNGNPGTNDIFVAKYDANGNLAWVKSYGGYSNDKARAIAVDPAGNIYITGEISTTATFGSITVTSAGGEDIFIAKLDGNGNALWAMSAGSANDEGGKGICADATGVYVTGYFSGTASFGASSLTSDNTVAPTFADVFLGKWDPSGNMVWLKQAGGDYDDVAWALALDNTGNTYLTGEFHGYAEFGTYGVTTIGHGEVFVAKYDALGNPQWAKRFGGELTDRGRGISTNGTSVVITGQYGGTLTHGSYTRVSADSSDIFVASFDAAGTEQWLVVPRGAADAYEALGYESGNGVHVDAAGMAYATGSFLDADTLNYITLPGWTRSDIFLGKIDPALTPGQNNVGISNPSAVNNIDIYPNPSAGWVNIAFNVTREDEYTIGITNALGQVIHNETRSMTGLYTKKIDLSSYGKGVYFVDVTNKGSRQVQRVVVY